MRRRAPLLLLACVAANGLACKPRSQTRGEPAPALVASSSAPQDAPAKPYAPPPQKPLAGLMCEGEGGLWRLLPDGGTAPVLAIWHHEGSPDRPPSEPGSFTSVSHGPDGAVYLHMTPGVMRVGDPLVAAFQFPYEGAEKATGERLAWSKRGVVWWGASALWESEVFPPARREDFVRVAPPAEPSFEGVVYDGANRLWVATHDALHVREGTTWTKAELPAYPSVHGLVVFEGVAHVLLQSKLVAYPAAATAPKIVADLPTSARELRVGKRGIVVLLEPASGKRAGALARYDGHTTKPLAGQLDSLIDYDEGGLVWGREKDGYVAIDELGARTFWPKGSIPGFAREFTRLCFVAGAYEKLPTVSPVRFGSAKGVVTRGGKPVGNARLELCESLPFAVFTTKTPCGGNGVSGKTGADGSFLVEKVPIGKYHLVVDLGDKWKGTSVLGSHGLPIVAEGFTADYGALALE